MSAVCVQPAPPAAGLAGWLAGSAAAAFAVDSAPAEAHHGRAMPFTDEQDIRATLGGDGDAYARLVRRHQDEIARQMWRFTRDRRDLEELVHDVFVEAYFSLAGFRGRAPLSHWLARIATRVGYRYWKRRKARRPATLSLAEWDAVADPPADARQAGELLGRLLARLRPRDRLVLTLMYLEGRSVAQTAELTGWSRTMVKVQAHRARKRLKAALAAAGQAPPPAGRERLP